MNQLDRYLIKTVGGMMAFAAIALVGMLSLFTFLEQIEDMRNNYTIWKVGQFVVLSVPRMFYETIPYSALIGCLAGLGLLANHSELVVMRAAGISTWSIAASVMKPAIVMVLVGLLIGEYLLPDFERSARVNRERAMSAVDQITPKFGFWYREGNLYMHFDEVGKSGVLQGVTHFYLDGQKRLKQSLFAERAVFHDMPGDRDYWLMEDITATDLQGDRSVIKRETSRRWDTRLTPELLSTEILVQPDKMSIAELSAKIDYMKAQGLGTGKFELGYWGKLFQPLATIALVLVAISFVFGPLREATMGMRVVTGLVIGILFKFVLDLLSPASLVFGFPPMVAILTPIVICLGAGFLLLKRAG